MSSKMTPQVVLDPKASGQVMGNLDLMKASWEAAGISASQRLKKEVPLVLILD